MKRSVCILLTVLFIFSINLLSACAKKETMKESGEEIKPAVQQEVKAPPESKPMEEKTALPMEEMKKAPEMEQKAVVPEKKETHLENIHFDFDKYNLRPEDRKILSGHAGWLIKNKEYNVKIEGNCDERGTGEYNMALGQRRADEAKKYLINMGVDKKRISTVSYGKDCPVDPGHNEEAWAKNRRDDFVLSK